MAKENLIWLTVYSIHKESRQVMLPWFKESMVEALNPCIIGTDHMDQFSDDSGALVTFLMAGLRNF